MGQVTACFLERGATLGRGYGRRCGGYGGRWTLEGRVSRHEEWNAEKSRSLGNKTHSAAKRRAAKTKKSRALKRLRTWSAPRRGPR